MGKRSENAIILIGNGFDLAHGMKTSYNDFAEWYLDTYICPTLKNIIYDLDYYNDNNNIFETNFLTEIIKIIEGKLPELNGTFDRFDAENIRNLRSNLFNKEENDRLKIIKDEVSKSTLNLKRILKNKFLADLYSDSYENWFDIENSYFFELKKILLEEGRIEFDRPNKKLVETLNKEFNEIKYALQHYLKTIEVKTNEDVNIFLKENFIGKENISIVNFNYTSTVGQYLNSFEYSIKTYDNTEIYTDVNHIHGKLDKKIIFGYGDDDSVDYKKMKQTGKDEYLEHFKTFAYLESYDYRSLIDNLNKIEDYEVYVLGHSLSLTDKTLLFEILNPKKCLNIHLFKRADIEKEDDKIQNIKKLHFNISRILNNDKDSRIKIVPIELTPHFPYVESLDNKIIKQKYKTVYNENIGEIEKDNNYTIDPEVVNLLP